MSAINRITFSVLEFPAGSLFWMYLQNHKIVRITVFAPNKRAQVIDKLRMKWRSDFLYGL